MPYALESDRPARPGRSYRWPQGGLLAAVCALILSLAAQAQTSSTGPDRIARMLAGLDVPAAGNLAVSTAMLERHAKSVGHWWGDYERRIGTPLREWAAREVAAAPGVVVFYPFSGPDFPTMRRLFPEASRYVMVSLQPADPPPDLDRASAADLGGFFERLGTAWRQFAQIGFFRTLDLEAEARRPNMRVGVTAALMAFSARMGYEVIAVEPVRVNAAGTDLEVHPGDRSSPATWSSVRLVLARDTRLVLLDYVRANLADAALKAEPAQRAWIERMAEHPTLLKAASHLLQQANFSILRDAVLERAPGVVQDETGIDYGRLSEAFVVTLHGRFARPHQLFRADAQRSLAAAYARATGTKALPFRMSYQRAEGANLQVAWRPGLQTVEARTRAARMPQAQMLEARIAGQLASYTQRRRKLFLTRSATETRHASYVDAIRSYVSSLLGARGRSANGAALISLSLAPDGTLQVVQVERNSGNTTFDRRVKTLLQGSRRFPAWPESMRKDGDLAVVMLHVPEL
jgi:hypothetical protein